MVCICKGRFQKGRVSPVIQELQRGSSALVRTEASMKPELL